MNAVQAAARPVGAPAAACSTARRPAGPAALLAAPAPCSSAACFRRAALQLTRWPVGARRRAAAAVPRAEQQDGGEVKVSLVQPGGQEVAFTGTCCAHGVRELQLVAPQQPGGQAWVPARAPRPAAARSSVP